MNDTTFPLLWSGDRDRTNLTTNTSAIDELAAGTDVPFDSPPKAVARWNRGDHAEFPVTNDSTSIHPPDATFDDSVVTEDASVEVFAVQPATRARQTTNRSTSRPPGLSGRPWTTG
ncbi:hypothetical protein [Natronomonas sp. EA1]|uniref:hypothetical protein n=1 Tax=Natronomonas sp. EA1 TaxID=3421655 RepID=UPI003EBDC756